MREVLFKAKRKNWKELPKEQWWVKGYLWNGNDHSYIIPYNFGIGYDSDTNSLRATAYEIDKDTICQYTGLTDKNGNKIWENDIVRTTRKLGYMREKGEKLKVYFNKFLCHFALSFGHGEDEAFDYMTLSGKKANFMEVVGNIFDNPELLQ